MVSLFTQLVARGVEVPVLDPRLIAHIDAPRAVVLDDDRPAAQPEVLPEDQASALQTSLPEDIPAESDGTLSTE
jgi:hypothetical protein